MKINDFWAKMSGLFIFYRWHPEVSLRYLPIVSDIKKNFRQQSVLDVGSGGLGIAPYLKSRVTGVDLDFKPPFHPLLNRVKGSALKLAFKDKTFDIVIGVDLLEHIKENEREKAVFEILRVAKKRAYLAVPCGKEAEKQDKLLNYYFRQKFGYNYHFLEEQLKYGLPEEEDLVKIIKHAARILNKKINIKIIDNENLQLREFLMKGWITNNLLVNFFYRKFMLITIPLLRLFNQRPVYRKIFIIKMRVGHYSYPHPEQPQL